MQTISVIALALGILVVLMALLCLWSLRKRDLGVVDLGWTLGVGLCGALYALLLDQGEPLRRAAVAVLAGAWSLRLAAHIFVHRVHRKQEDARYARLRATGDLGRVSTSRSSSWPRRLWRSSFPCPC